MVNPKPTIELDCPTLCCSKNVVNCTEVGLRSSSLQNETLLKRRNTGSFRRGGVNWASTSRLAELRPTPEAFRGKSCLKVATLEDSLRNCQDGRRPSTGPGGWSGLELMKGKISSKFRMSGKQLSSILRNPHTTEVLSSIGLPQSCGEDEDGSKWDSLSVDSRSDDECGTPLVPKPTRISWGTLEINEYGILLGDSFHISSGPPVFQGRNRISSQLLDIDKYEFSHPPRKRLREMKFTPKEREKRLRASGLSKCDLKRSTRKIEKAQKLRERTIKKIRENGLYEERHERLESALMKLKYVLRIRKSDLKEEDELWDKAQRRRYH